MSLFLPSDTNTSGGAEVLKRELIREVDSVKNNVIENVQKKKEQVEILKTDRNILEMSLNKKKRELENKVLERDSLVETVDTLKRQVLDLTYKSVGLEENLRVMKHNFECKLLPALHETAKKLWLFSDYRSNKKF